MNQWRFADFARRIGITRQLLNHYLKRASAPAPGLSAKIVKITRGRVRLCDLTAKKKPRRKHAARR
jgi:DNA-binding transcriptional regulator YdaS (Cro superfamily)